MRRLFLPLIFLFALPRLYASPQINATPSDTKLTPGTSIFYNIEIQWKKSEGQYTFALPALPVENLTIVNQGESQESFFKDGEEWSRKTFSFEITGQKSGKALIRGFILPYVDPAAQTRGEFSLSEIPITVLPPPLPWKKIGLAAAGALALIAAIAGFIIGGIKARKKREQPPELTPKERAVQHFQSRIASVTQSEKGKEALQVLSSELRVFLLEYYGFDIRKVPENDWMEILKSQSAGSEESERIRKLVKKLEEAKYRGEVVTDFDVRAIERDLKEFLDGKRVFGNT